MKTIFTILLLTILNLGFSQNKLWTCINEKGEQLFEIKAMQVYEFHNGLARVYKNTLVNNKWVTGYGYINKSGQVVITCDLKKAYDFVGKYTWVKKKDQDYYTLINIKGEVIPTKPYKKVGYFFEDQTDICAVYEDRRMGFINMQGEEIIPCKYMGGTKFINGLVCVAEYDNAVEKYGFINKKGEIIIPLKHMQAGSSSFSGDKARMVVSGRTVLIDTTGKTVFKTSHGTLQSSKGNLLSVFKGKNRTDWGWVDLNDNVVIPQKYDHAVNFNEDGLAVVELDDLKGVIDTTGKIVIPLKYKTVYCDFTQDGFILGVLPSKEELSLMDSEKDYFNGNFEKMETTKFQYLQHADGATLIAFYFNGKLGYMNRNYEIIVPAKYTKAKQFSEGFAFVR